MSYATIQNATDLYGDQYVQSSIDRDVGNPDDSAFTKALANASSEIDSYIGVRYDVPLVDPIPAIVTQYCVDIAIYKSSSSFGGGLTEEKRKRYDDALNWLKAVAKSLANIIFPTIDETTEALPQLISEQRLFTRTGLGGL